MSGRKDTANKIKFELIAPEAIRELARVLTEGAEKYEPRNWEKGIAYSKILGAVKRHINEFELGNRIDSETGMHHLAHAMCSIMFLLTYELRDMYDYNDLPHYNGAWRKCQRKALTSQ